MCVFVSFSCTIFTWIFKPIRPVLDLTDSLLKNVTSRVLTISVVSFLKYIVPQGFFSTTIEIKLGGFYKIFCQFLCKIFLKKGNFAPIRKHLL